MNLLPKKLILAFVVLAAACGSYADEAMNNDSVGTLGKRYSQLDFTLSDINHISDNQYDVGIGINYPVLKYLDVSGGYDYAWLHTTISGIKADAHAHTVNVAATGYMTYQGVKPFASAMLGYSWQHADASLGSLSASANTDFGVWGLAVGVEIPVSVVSIDPFISYQDDFQNSTDSVQAFSFGVGANYWINKEWGVHADVSYSDVLHSSFDQWNYTVGVRYRF